MGTASTKLHPLLDAWLGSEKPLRPVGASAAAGLRRYIPASVATFRGNVRNDTAVFAMYGIVFMATEAAGRTCITHLTCAKDYLNEAQEQ
jgi:hypothetical protein